MKATAYQQQDDDGYEQFLASLRERFRLVVSRTPHLFTTDAEGLFFTFLGGLPNDKRQHYTCHACRRFVERFGGLVTLDQSGAARSVMWDAESAPPLFAASVAALEHAVTRAKVTGVHLSSASVWGEPETAPWHHMAVTALWSILYKPTPLCNATQTMAERREEMGMLARGLNEFPRELVLKAKALLESDSLYRSEKVLGVATWLLDLHDRTGATKDTRARSNMIWLAAATAPPGWCHVRSTMIGTLLEDLASGAPFEAVARRFADKMRPLQYQRPTAAPSDGQIAAAEKVIDALKSAGALDRRFARIEDLQLLWKPIPRADKPAGGGVFDHLRGKSDEPIDTGAPAVTMTWVKFAREVLAKAGSIEVATPTSNGNFLAFVTAANPDAPPVLQWDSPEKRNPVSHYVYHGGSPARKWGLRPGVFVACTGIALDEAHWNGGMVHHNETATFVLAGAKDIDYERSGGLFPETLRSEYHGIRATLEAHFMRSTIAGRDEATACGLCIGKNGSGVTVRVTAGGVRSLYRIDRWD